MTSYASYIAMILIQIAYGGSNILIKVAIDKGLDQLLVVVYRHVIAMFVLFPFAFVLRRRQRPALILGEGQDLCDAFTGSYSSPKRLFCRPSLRLPNSSQCLEQRCSWFNFHHGSYSAMESVEIRQARGQAKVVGALICVGGALIFTFWKGGVLLRAFVERPLILVHATRHHRVNEIKGSFLILLSHVAWSAWLVLLCSVVSQRSDTCFFVSLQSPVLALFFARDLSFWRLELIDGIAGGSAAIGRDVLLTNMVYQRERPCFCGHVYSAVASFCGNLLFRCFCREISSEQVDLFHYCKCILLGAFLITGGLYCVLWGKSLDAARVTKKGKNEHKNGNEVIHVCVQQQES
ncbi:auxin-induced protein 5NG4-like [Prosopis cineraria]|uniref:auxin-induced protein 5NG4-like n=1 Tax=Prosopis cineraria TaxID=364024 RepID=UPI00240ED935|nr:auxin-induced protein 5NG4-like [Prosopis cineraria]